MRAFGFISKKFGFEKDGKKKKMNFKKKI